MMDWGKIIFIFFTLSSATSTAGFLYSPDITILFVAVALNLIAAFGILQVLHNEKLAYVFVIGAMLANIFSLILLLIESAQKNDTDF